MQDDVYQDLDSCIRDYEKKAEPFDLLPGYEIYFEPGMGFFCYGIEDGDKLCVDHCNAKDMDYLHAKAKEIAKERGCQYVMTQTFRSPRSYLRKTRSHLDLTLSGYRPNGKFYWVFIERI